MFYFTSYPSQVGNITLASDGTHIVGLWIEGQKYHGGTISKAMTEKENLPIFISARKWLDRYFAGEKPSISEISLSFIGGEFRQNVWKILCQVPYGKVITYSDIAKRVAAMMDKPRMSAQAVGGAVAHNPISIIIPCHRVVGVNGNLTGYAGGIDVKIKLLELEGADMTNLFIPKRGTAL